MGLHTPDFGDCGLHHEVHVFVYRYALSSPEYLLLQPHPAHDAIWTPVVRSVQVHEAIPLAAVRGVRESTGLDHPFDLVSPPGFVTEEIGDLWVVEWPVGFQLRHPTSDPKRRGCLADYRWAEFDEALQTLTGAAYRSNLLQLHWRLMAA